MQAKWRLWPGLVAIGLTVGLAASPAGAQDAAAQDEEEPYTIENGKVDKGTYNGWRRYHASCHTCHGPDGLGSSYAPNLVDSLKTMTYTEFAEVVINGRENVTTAKQSVMPAFGMVENVALYIDDIYAYLEARSDGVLGRGRPARMQ